MHAMLKKKIMVASITINANTRIAVFQAFSNFACLMSLLEALMFYKLSMAVWSKVSL